MGRWGVCLGGWTWWCTKLQLACVHCKSTSFPFLVVFSHYPIATVSHCYPFLSIGTASWVMTHAPSQLSIHSAPTTVPVPLLYQILTHSSFNPIWDFPYIAKNTQKRKFSFYQKRILRARAQALFWGKPFMFASFNLGFREKVQFCLFF